MVGERWVGSHHRGTWRPTYGVGVKARVREAGKAMTDRQTIRQNMINIYDSTARVLIRTN